MKYVESIKTVVLTCLILLSLAFTFMIWTYKPEYPLTEEPQLEKIMIGEEKKKSDIIKPYRLLYKQEEDFTGTASLTAIDEMMTMFLTFNTSSLRLENNNLLPVKLNEMIAAPSTMTMFYQTDIPIDIFSEMLSFEESVYHAATFNRVLIDLENIQLTNIKLYFASTTANTLYTTTVSVPDVEEFERQLATLTENFLPYNEIQRKEALSLYVTKERLEALQYTYYADEISPDLLKSVLFEQPNIVQKTVEGSVEKYMDSMSLMTLDTNAKNMNYVYPTAESSTQLDYDSLLTDTFDYINDHGGFKGDYRLSMMDLENHITEFQLYLQGYPVFSGNTLTRLSTTWGDNRIFRYRRPYYVLYMDIATEKTVRQLTAGTDVIQYIERYSELSLAEIDDIVVGYYLIQNENSLLFVLEPSWFVLSGNNWTRLTLDKVGGFEYGLE